MPAPPVLLDANVLVPLSTRDLFLDADIANLVRVRWTDAILAEVQRNVMRFTSAATATSLIAEMNRIFPDARVTAYEGFTAQMTNDPKDRHVAAAAASIGADILTFNLRHFPAATLAPFGVRAFHPDEFLAGLADTAIGTFAEILRDSAARRRNPPVPLSALVARLATPLPQFAAQMRAHYRATDEPGFIGKEVP